MFTECVDEKLLLFSKLPIATSIEKVEDIPIKSSNSIIDSESIEFYCPSLTSTYVDLSNVWLEATVQIVADAANTKHTDEKVTLINNPLNSLFKRCSVSMNNTPTSSVDTNFPFKTYFSQLLSYDNESASTHLHTSGWSLDRIISKQGLLSGLPAAPPPAAAAPQSGGGGAGGSLASTQQPQQSGQVGAPPPNTDLVNVGLEYRKKLFGKSKEVKLYGKLQPDIFTVNRYLLNNVDMRIVLTRSEDRFVILAESDTDTSKVKLINLTLWVRYLTIAPDVLVAQERILSQRNALYYYKKIKVVTRTLPPQVNFAQFDNLGVDIPEKMLFCLVDNIDFDGSITTSPYNFKPFDITEFNLTMNGNNVLSSPLTFSYHDPENIDSSRGYNQLLQALGYTNTMRTCQVTKDMFDLNQFIIAYNLTKSRELSSIDCISPVDEGVMRAEVKFREKLPNSVVLLCIMEFCSELQIDSARRVYVSH